MKHVSSFVSALILLAAPVLSFLPAQADAQSWQTVGQLTAVAAQLEAEQNSLSSGQPLACAALFSAPAVRVGQQVALAWGSVGALDPLTSTSSISMWPQDGVSTLTFTQSGTWTYFFTFYSASNATTTCSAKIVVAK